MSSGYDVIVSDAGSIARQAAGYGIFTPGVNCRVSIR